jgi:nucleotide-binding universal stress UspA family protein
MLKASIVGSVRHALNEAFLMTPSFSGYKRILAATDFSADADAALRCGLWLAHQSKSALVLAHVVANLREAVSKTSYRSRIEFLEGREEPFQRELRRCSDRKLQAAIEKLRANSVKITYETLLGHPHVELIHTVQQEQYDLVVLGSRRDGLLKNLGLGSTTRRMVRHCPSSVWVVKQDRPGPPAAVLAAVDLSEVSRRALAEAVWIAENADAKLHIVHVVEASELPADLLDLPAAQGPYRTLRELLQHEANDQLDRFLTNIPLQGLAPERHILWGQAWREIVNLSVRLKVELVALGTVGRSGMEGILLGNTAENVLAEVNCDVLAVKPANFASSIAPATWSLHPGPEKDDVIPPPP